RPRSSCVMAMGWMTSGSEVTTWTLKPGGSLSLAAVCSAVSAGSVATGRPLSSRGEAAKVVTAVTDRTSEVREVERMRIGRDVSGNRGTVQILYFYAEDWIGCGG